MPRGGTGGHGGPRRATVGHGRRQDHGRRRKTEITDVLNWCTGDPNPRGEGRPREAMGGNGGSKSIGPKLTTFKLFFRVSLPSGCNYDFSKNQIIIFTYYNLK